MEGEESGEKQRGVGEMGMKWSCCLQWLECRAHNLLISWNHTAEVHSKKLKKVLTVEIQL